MNFKYWCGLLAAMGIGLPAFAATPEVATERAFEIERYNISYRIHADGSYTEERESAIKVLKPQALEDIKENTIGYSTSIQKAEVLQAYTLKPDGRRIEVPKSNYQVQINGGKGDGAPVFSDVTRMTVIFPELAVGDTVVFSYRLVGSQPLFDKQFSEVESFSREVYYGEVNVSFDAPADLPMRHEAWQMESVRDEVVDGRRINQWRYHNTAPLKPNLARPLFEFERHPGVAYSTFASYADIAQAYGVRATAKAAVTDRIRQLANEAAGSRSETREVAKALYEWVATHITYAGNCIGLGAVVPHDLDFVLDNRMGDCKDQATLLQALLAAKGIQSTQALINSGRVYRLTRTPVVSMVNHVINYIPSMDLYLDPTSEDTPFGMLPYSDQGKPVFLVDGYREGTRTPVPAPGKNRQTLYNHMKIAADGSIAGELKIEQQGMIAVASRAHFRDANREQTAQSIDAYFKRMGNNGNGSIDYEDATALEDHYRYSLRFKADQVLPVPGALAVTSPFPTGAMVASLLSQANMEIDDEGEIACGNIYSQEEYVLDFAPSIKIKALPPNLKLTGPATSYEAQYSRKGNQVRIRRVIDDQTPGPTCTPAFMREYRTFMQKALSNLKAQLVYQ